MRAVTSPVNERSIAFHRAIGFEVERVDESYDGAGAARVLFVGAASRYSRSSNQREA